VARVLILPNFRVNAKRVGQSAEKIAKEAGFAIPKGTRALVAPLDGIGRDHPLSAEKLSPVLSFYVVKDSREALDVCMRFLRFGGMGHTMSIHASDNNIIREFALKLPAFRMIANSPMNLLNIKRLAYETKPVNPELAGKGVPKAAPPPSTHAARPVAAQPTATVISGGVTQEHITHLVERFLSARGTASGNPAPASQANPGAPAAPSEKPAPPPAPTMKPVDFVSEDDVRQAIKRGEKIVVGPRTIITPSAHDLGDPLEIFIRAQS
jgi:acetaldehyde dehydrogenase (acetylating)